MMMTENFIWPVTSTVVLMTIYIFTKNHMMNNLIMIEFIVVSIMMIMFTVMKVMDMENYLVLYFLITAITESIVGLSLIIALIRTHGNDYLKSTLTLKF